MADEENRDDKDKRDKRARDREEETRDPVKAARKVRTVVDTAKRGGNSVDKFDKLVADGEEALDEIGKAKGLDGRSALKIAREQSSGKTQRVLSQAEKVADEGLSVNSVTAMAESDDIPMNEELRAVFKEYNNQTRGGKPDFDKIAHVPGMVVNKKTGDVNLFGLEFLPVPVQYASMLSVGYTLGVSLVNRWVFKNAFKTGRSLTTAVGAQKHINPQTVGKYAGYGSIAVTTHWPDVNTFMQSEHQYKEQAQEITQQLAPILDRLKGNHKLSAFYRVKAEENEVIYNERQRLNTKLNAERYRNAVQALGRSAVFVASAVDGHQTIQGLTPDVVEEVAGPVEQKAQEIASTIERYEAQGLTREEAFDLAKSEAFNAATNAAEKSSGSAISNTTSDVRNYAAVLVTLAAQSVGNAIFGKRMEKMQPISAYDMVSTLRQYLDEDPKQSAFPLPEGMRVEGAKGPAADELPLAEYIVQIFQQHERDCGGDDARVPSRLEGKLQEAAELIAEDLREGKLDGMALVNLVGERQIVRNNGKTVADTNVVRREVNRLRAHLRHIEWVDGDDYIADSSFSKQELKAAWDGMDDEERNIFVSLVPAQVLESAGVDAKEVRERRQLREQEFDKDVVAVLKGAVELGDEMLKKHTMTKEEIALFHEAEKAVNEKGVEGIFKVMPGAGKEKNVAQPLTELVVRHTQYGGRLGNLLHREQAAAVQ